MSDQIAKTIIVKGDPAKVYDLWSDFENFPHFMKNIKYVRKTGAKTSHWVMAGPMGKELEWDAQITDVQENKRIAWSSTDGDIKTSGQVTFNPLVHGETEVTVLLKFSPPGGPLGDAAARLLDNPDKKLEEDLRRFKRYVEMQTVAHN